MIFKSQNSDFPIAERNASTCLSSLYYGLEIEKVFYVIDTLKIFSSSTLVMTNIVNDENSNSKLLKNIIIYGLVKVLNSLLGFYYYPYILDS